MTAQKSRIGLYRADESYRTRLARGHSEHVPRRNKPPAHVHPPRPIARYRFTAGRPKLAEQAATLTQKNTKSIANSAVSTRATDQNDAKTLRKLQTPLRLQRQGKPLGVGQITPHQAGSQLPKSRSGRAPTSSM